MSIVNETILLFFFSLLFSLVESIATVCSIRIFSRTVNNAHATKSHIAKNMPYFHRFVDRPGLFDEVGGASFLHDRSVSLVTMSFSSSSTNSFTLMMSES